MKKLGITLLAAALSLPLTFAATQGAQSTPSTGQAQTTTPKSQKKHTKSTTAKKHHNRRNKGTTSGATAAPATK